MSDYIFNCFKEHVTTGLVCSLSAGAPDVLTVWKGRRRSAGESVRGSHFNILAHVHIYRKMAD